MRIAYSGIEGAFAHIAAGKIFPGQELQAFGDFRSAYEAVEKGDCDYAVLPIENSYAGEVGQVWFFCSFRICQARSGFFFDSSSAAT